MPADQDECVEVEQAGRFVSDAGIEERVLSFDFGGLPLSAYNILLYVENEDASVRRIYYRSRR